MKPREILPLVKDTFLEWKRDDALHLGAALAYYTTFSLAPLLLVVIAVAGIAFGREAVQGRLVGEIQGLMGRQGAEAVQAMIANAGRYGSGILATAVGAVAVLFGASGVFAELQSALNRIWKVEAKPGRSGIWGFLRSRLISFGMVLGIGFLLMVSLVLSAALAALGTYATGLLPGAEALLRVLGILLSLAAVVLLLAMIYRFLPDVRLAWRDVWIGAVVTALLFTLGRYLIGLYLGRSSVASAYGAAGSLVVVLLWVYYSSQILFFGAEFTRIYAQRHGSRIVPDEHAVPAGRQKLGRREEAEEKETGAPERPRRRRRRSGTG